MNKQELLKQKIVAAKKMITLMNTWFHDHSKEPVPKRMEMLEFKHEMDRVRRQQKYEIKKYLRR